MMLITIFTLTLFFSPPVAMTGDQLTESFVKGRAKIPFIGEDSALFVGPSEVQRFLIQSSDDFVCGEKNVNTYQKAMSRLEATTKTDTPENSLRLLYLKAQLATALESTLPDADKYLSEYIALAPTQGKEKYLMGIAMRGIVRLRLAELMNCVNNHNAESCIFPLSRAAVHKSTFWTQKALEDFSLYLKNDPKNLHVRWLLNLTYMAMGKYPREVPKQYLLKSNVMGNQKKFKKFHDVAGSIGIQKYRLGGGGALIEDINGDGLMDILLAGRLNCTNMRVFQNNGDGSFSEPVGAEVIEKQPAVTNIIQADFNNDGKLDLYLSRGGWQGKLKPAPPIQNTLLVNAGDWKFVDKSEELGLHKDPSFNASAQWVDFDLDGWVDLFVCNENRHPDLFKNIDGKKFVEVSEEMGIKNVGVCKGSAWADINGDGWPDLVIANYGSENKIFLNEEGKHFREVKIPVINHNPTLVFSAFFFDYDNDGRPDLFLGAYNRDISPLLHYSFANKNSSGMDTMKVFHNISTTTEIKFEDATEKLGLNIPTMSMGSNFGDLDNDGYLDFFLGTGSISFGDLVPNQVFHNVKGKKFEEVTYAGGFGNLQKGHGVSFGDIKNDGNEDILVNLGGVFAGDSFFPSLYENPGFNNDWITLRLEGTVSNRSAIGANVMVRVKNADGQIRKIYRTVGATSSFGSNPLQVHVGLGRAVAVEEVQVTWPNRMHSVSAFKKIPKNAFLKIKEGNSEFEILHLPRIKLRQRKEGHQHENS